ncbi:MAG TPA: hypothetical protein VK807_10320 [Gemmatimonadaceae bacterium]|jgi:hypothetical protein|nr:hypothetical protein [Gemmatimonadaceae bacterium]
MPHRSMMPLLLIPMALVGLAVILRKDPKKEPTASEAGRRLGKEAKAKAKSPAKKRPPRSK